MSDDHTTPPSSTLPTSTLKFNRQLDQQIIDREPRELDAPWFARRFFATVWSTVKPWFQ